MKDILLDREGDIKLTMEGDVSLVTSPVQAVLIKLRWFFHEWVYGPELGIPWYESILVKDPDIEGIKKRFIREIMDVDDVVEVTQMDILLNPSARKAACKFQFRTSEAVYNEEVVMHG